MTTPLSRPLPQLQLCELPLDLYATRSVTSWGERIRHMVSGWALLGRPVIGTAANLYTPSLKPWRVLDPTAYAGPEGEPPTTLHGQACYPSNQRIGLHRRTETRKPTCNPCGRTVHTRSRLQCWEVGSCSCPDGSFLGRRANLPPTQKARLVSVGNLPQRLRLSSPLADRGYSAAPLRSVIPPTEQPV